MPDFRVADTASEHPKMRAAGLAAIGLWAAAGAWAMNPAHLTDGWVPAYYVASWPTGKRLAATLVKVGLWRVEDRDGMPGWQFHDWSDIQRSADQIALEKATNAVRRELYGSPKLVAAIKERDADRCRYCRRSVSWTDRRGSGGATFDHVVPIPQGGKNDLANVVVACRGCNSGKRSRTPEQAGMTLLPPPSKPDANQSKPSSGTRSEPALHSAPHPHPVPSSGDLGGEGHLSHASETRPPERCSRHQLEAHPGPCGACADARRTLETWTRQQTARIRSCQLCDADGRRWDPAGRHRGTTGPCDHQPLPEQRAAG